METVEIPLKIKSETFQISLSFLVDKYVYDKFNLKDFEWKVRYDNDTFCVYTRILNKKIFLHRMITRCPKNKVVDHIDGDGLNNLLENLRICSISENNLNSGKPKNKKCTSKYIGVSLLKNNKNRPWRAHASIKNKTVNLGHFKTEIEAAKARDKFVLKHRGKFARLNFGANK